MLRVFALAVDFAGAQHVAPRLGKIAPVQFDWFCRQKLQHQIERET
jgi:hypothetical protein